MIDSRAYISYLQLLCIHYKIKNLESNALHNCNDFEAIYIVGTKLHVIDHICSNKHKYKLKMMR